jgi:uncharacterized repeat protein (TIGR03833 family)
MKQSNILQYTGGKKSKKKSKKSKKKIKKIDLTKTKRKKPPPMPKIGEKVQIAIKPYKGKIAKGIVKKVLTKVKYHTRGHKVLLESGEIGRVFL